MIDDDFDEETLYNLLESSEISERITSTSCLPTSSLLSECVICSQPSHGIHFGVTTCRACAAFFRRTVVLNKKYSCKQSDGKCDLGPEVRSLCRHCRYEKCLQVGMTPDNVQWNRDRLCNAMKLEDFEKMEKDEQKGLNGKEQTMEMASKSSPEMPIEEIRSNQQGTTVIKIKPPPPPHIAQLISDLGNVTKRVERIFMQSTPMEIVSAFPLTALQRMAVATERLRGFLPSNPPMLPKLSFELLLSHLIKNRENGAKWMMHCEEFARLPLEEKLLIYQKVCGNLARLEKVAVALAVVGEEALKKKLFLMEGHIMSPLTEFDVCGMSNYSDEEIRRFMWPSMENLFEDLGRPLHALSPAPLEYIYLLCTTMWNVDGRGVSPETIRVADTYRERISAELHDYYIHSKGQENYAHRLIQLHRIRNNNERHELERSELFLMFRLFDVFHFDFPCGGDPKRH